MGLEFSCVSLDVCGETVSYIYILGSCLQVPSTKPKFDWNAPGPIDVQEGTRNNGPVLCSTWDHWLTKFVPSKVETKGWLLTLNWAGLSLWALMNCATWETGHMPQQS